MRVLYAGDSPPGGASDYLLGILRFLRATVWHVPPTRTLALSDAAHRYDAIILSDFPHCRMPAMAEAALVDQVARGTGLLMVGGWASFAAGGWRGTAIEQSLPVVCRPSDDRVHFSSGAIVCAEDHHVLSRGFSFRERPVICGLNDVRPRRTSRIVLTARKIMRTERANELRLARDAQPLLIIGTEPRRRVAALATDLAPHWCGGLVDWGRRRVRLAAAPRIRIEVGDRYLRFVAGLVRWLTRAV